MGNNYIETIKKHIEKHKDFYKNNQNILMVIGIMIPGYFIAKMWTIKYGTLMYLTTIIILTTQLKITIKKSNKNLPTTKKT